MRSLLVPVVRTAVVAALLSTAHAVAWACSCMPDPAPDPDLYGAVFLGEALGTGPRLGCNGGFADSRTRFEVVEAFAGTEAGARVRVAHSTSDASCGVEYERGETYLVFASETDDGTLVTSLCSPGGHEAQEGGTLDYLRDL